MRTLQDLRKVAAEQAATDLTTLVSFYLARRWADEEVAAISRAEQRQTEIDQEVAHKQVRATTAAEAGIAQAEISELWGEMARLTVEIEDRRNFIAQLRTVEKPSLEWLTS